MIVWVKSGEVGKDGLKHGFHVSIDGIPEDMTGELHCIGTRVDTQETMIVSTGDDRRPLKTRRYVVTEMNGPGALSRTYSGVML